MLFSAQLVQNSNELILDIKKKLNEIYLDPKFMHEIDLFLIFFILQAHQETKRGQYKKKCSSNQNKVL